MIRSSLKTIIYIVILSILVTMLLYKYYPRVRYYEISKNLYLIKPSDCTFDDQTLLLKCEYVSFDITQIDRPPAYDALGEIKISNKSGYKFYFLQREKLYNERVLYILNNKAGIFLKVNTISGNSPLTSFFYDYNSQIPTNQKNDLQQREGNAESD